MRADTLLPGELGLFLYAAGLPGPGGKALLTPGEEPLNWPQLERLAVAHQVYPFLYKLMEKTGPGSIPAPVRNRIQALYKENALRNYRLVRELLKVWALCDRQGIDVIPFKGPVMAIQAYGDLDLRSFSDIDLLVKTRDFHTLVQGLVEKGFKPGFSLTASMGRFICTTHRDFRFTGSFGALDFHQRLIQGPSYFDLYGRLHRERLPMELLDRQIMAPATEHTLLAACLNGTKDGWRTLRSVLDVALLVTHHPQMDWAMLKEDASRAGCLTMVHTGLELARRVTGIDLPVTFPGRGREKKAQRLAQDYLNNLARGEIGDPDKLPQVASMARSLDGTLKKMHYLAYYSFTPSPMDRQGFPLPRGLYFLYFFLRPFRLFAGLIKRFGRIFFKKKPHIERQ